MEPFPKTYCHPTMPEYGLLKDISLGISTRIHINPNPSSISIFGEYIHKRSAKARRDFPNTDWTELSPRRFDYLVKSNWHNVSKKRITNNHTDWCYTANLQYRERRRRERAINA